MKNFSFLVALSALFVFVSCSELGDLFDSQLGKLPIKIHLEHSRANDTSFERGDEVGLFVVNYDGTVAGSLATSGNHVDNLRYTLLSDWTPDTEVYWLDETTKADFYAYYPYGTPSDVLAYGFKVKADQSFEEEYWASDFLWGKKSGVSPSLDAVALTMEHVFSNALIYIEAGENFTAEQLAAANVEVSLCNVMNIATIDLTTGVATATGDTTTITPWNTGSYYRAMVVPQTVSSDVTLVTVTINGTKYTHATDITFKAGTQHKITVTVSAPEGSDTPSNGLSVNFSIKEWNLDSEDYGGEGVVEENGNTPGEDAGETPTPTVLEFYADTTMGNGSFDGGMSLLSAIGLPGHFFNATSSNGDFASMIMLDYDFQSYGCESYTYLTEHFYPLVAGSIDSFNIPTESCFLVDHPGYTFFEFNGKPYYPVVPESATDAEGEPYGVCVMTNAQMGEDLNMLLFYLPAVDDEGNPAVIRGSYIGPLGYELTNNTTQVFPFNLNDRGLTAFTAYQNGDILTLMSNYSTSGSLVLTLNLAQNNGEVEGTWMALEDGSGSLSGCYCDGLGGEFNITTGLFSLEATGTAGTYTLTASSRNPVSFVGSSITYQLDSSVEYTITVTDGNLEVNPL